VKALTRASERLRVGPFRADAFPSRMRSERVAALLGISLGVTFAVCFATGLLSHLIQHPPSWFTWPARPAGLYRIIQGAHVATGLASIPLLLAKLWAVYPRLWTWPPVRNLLHGVERAALIPLVGGSLFMLQTGLVNIGLFYPWGFFFPAAHFWAAWITIGALIVHIGAKLTIAVSALRTSDPEPEDNGGLSRRGFLGVVGASAGAITLTTVGQTVGPLSCIAVLAPRHPDVGPQGFPVNQSATEAHVMDAATSPAYRLEVTGAVQTALFMTLDELLTLPQNEATLPISCVEGWSATIRWKGVRVADLLDMAGADPSAGAMVESLQRGGIYRTSELNPSHAHDPDTLLAFHANGAPLHIDHGYPVRLIGPNRPGVMQTKWVAKLIVA
jgi:hypothetical protein